MSRKRRTQVSGERGSGEGQRDAQGGWLRSGPKVTCAVWRRSEGRAILLQGGEVDRNLMGMNLFRGDLSD